MALSPVNEAPITPQPSRWPAVFAAPDTALTPLVEEVLAGAIKLQAKLDKHRPAMPAPCGQQRDHRHKATREKAVAFVIATGADGATVRAIARHIERDIGGTRETLRYDDRVTFAPGVKGKAGRFYAAGLVAE